MSGGTRYMCADLHLRHAKAPEFRPFIDMHHHDEAVIDGLASVAKRKRDTLLILGDCAFTKTGLMLLKKVPARKWLIGGNHDTNLLKDYAEVFDKVLGCFEDYDGVLFSHMPVHTSELDRYWLNCHGHLHDRKLSDPRYMCVSLEHTGYKPIPVIEAIQEQRRLLGVYGYETTLRNNWGATS